MTEQVETAVKQRDSSGRFVKGNTLGYQPGESGNPAGKDPGITSVQREMLDTPCPYDNHSPQKTWRQWLAEKGLIQAAEKEMALEHLKDRLEGRVELPVKVEGEGIVVTLIREAIGGRNDAEGTG